MFYLLNEPKSKQLLIFYLLNLIYKCVFIKFWPNCLTNCCDYFKNCKKHFKMIYRFNHHIFKVENLNFSKITKLKMKSILNLSFALFLSVAIFSCKDKAANAADATQTAAVAEGAKYTVAPDAAKISWEGSKPGGKHVGTINVSSGDVTVANGAVTSGSFVIDMNSITVTDLTGDDKAGLEEHLKGTGAEGADDFFSVTKFPTAKFDIVSVTPTTEGGVNSMVKGNLTIKDVSKEISFPANITVTDGSVVVTSNAFNINRTDWGIKYGSKSFFKDLGDKFIDDNIVIQIMVEAKTDAPAAAPVQ